jgi:hypothetical protein
MIHFSADTDCLTADAEILLERAESAQPRTIDARWVESQITRAIGTRSVPHNSAPTRAGLISAAREAQAILPTGHAMRRLIDAIAALEA